MRQAQFYFINEEIRNKIDKETKNFSSGDASAEKFLENLKTLLPMHKTDKQTWKARVEGFYEVSELMFKELLALGKTQFGETWNRKEIVNRSKMRPLSYYHWITGSREPVSNVLTRDDYLNDPVTSLVKLEDDIIAMARLLRELQKNK